MTTNLIAAAIVAFALAYCANIATKHSSSLSWVDISDSAVQSASVSNACSRCAL